VSELGLILSEMAGECPDCSSWNSMVEEVKVKGMDMLAVKSMEEALQGLT